MKVVKFGGSSLASAEQVRKVCDIVVCDAERKIVVVSAPGKRETADSKVTDLLIAAANARLGGQPGEVEIDRVIARYAAIAADLGLPDGATDDIAADLRARLAMATADAGLYLDTLKAAGEDNCAKLVATYLRARGVDAHYVDPRAAGMVLSEESGNARVLEEAYARLSTLRDLPGRLIFPGFFGYSRSGKVVTFPRGGSDITGAILARAVAADVYENFTDVDSVFAASPAIVAHPEAVTEITYREMRELSYAGFSVFHDEALEPVFHAGITVNIKNTNNPAAPGTRIVARRAVAPQRPVVGIAASRGFCSIYVSKYMMNREIGFGRRLLQIFEEEGLSFEHMPSGIDNISVIVPESAFTATVAAHILGRISRELDADDVSVERGLTLVMVVGEGMSHTVGLAGRACRAFARAAVNLEMINQGSSEVSMMFGIKDDDMTAAVRALYEEFFAAVPA
ncbi:MAG TPA: aspartate kinase [Armatimonadota bacterium]|nr:aspartate kinase [Armatimonadota bacterium]